MNSSYLFYKKFFIKKKSNKNVILLPDCNTFLIINSIKTKKNHHLTRVLNDDFDNKVTIKEYSENMMSNIIENCVTKKCVNSVLEELVDNVCENHDFINYKNWFYSEDFAENIYNDIPLDSIMHISYYLYTNNQ